MSSTLIIIHPHIILDIILDISGSFNKWIAFLKVITRVGKREKKREKPVKNFHPHHAEWGGGVMVATTRFQFSWDNTKTSNFTE